MSDVQNKGTPVVAPETTKVGRRGTVVLPARMRRRLGLEEGALVVLEETRGGILVRPAAIRRLQAVRPQSLEIDPDALALRLVREMPEPQEPK